MLEINKNLSNLIFIADMKGLEIVHCEVGKYNYHEEEKTIYELTVKNEKGIESKIKGFIISSLLDNFNLISIHTNKEFTIFRFYEIKGGENESN